MVSPKKTDETLLAPAVTSSEGMWKFELFAFVTIVFSHCQCYYFYYCNFFNNGYLSYPANAAGSFDLTQSVPWATHVLGVIYETTFPTQYAFLVYFAFIALETILGCILPGVWIRGMPVPSEKNVQHLYLCNGLACWWVTLAVVFGLHFTGLWKLSELAIHFGPVLTVSVICGNVVTIIMHVAAHLADKVNRKTGYFFWDMFMGVYLNPRIGFFDFKMWAEIRVSWTLLFFLTCSAAAVQFERDGAISGNMWIMIVAHFLYTNACQKGEECIPTTWDFFYENWGWMLIFWNLAGVPFVYCFQSFYILNHKEIVLPTWLLTLLFVVLFAAYYVWDTANSQKNFYRMSERNAYVDRKWAFPRLPWRYLENAKIIKAENGGSLLVDGWWQFLRKPHYMADICMATVWACSCGFNAFLPFYYPLFFFSMLIHREWRDRARLSKKYGKDWDRYVKAVPYAFIPGII